MAIAYDTSSDSGNINNTDGSVKTLSHTCTGANGALIVSVAQNPFGISGVTYAGVAMTFLTSISSADADIVYLYYLLNPATGANNIAVTISGYTSGTVHQRIFGASYTGVSSVNPDSSNSGTASGNTKAVATTIVASNCWLICSGLGETDSTTSSTVTATGRTTRKTASDWGYPGNRTVGLQLSDTNGVIATGSQSTTFTTTKSGGSTFVTTGGIVMSLAPVIIPTVTTQSATQYIESLTGNGNITDTGGSSPTRRGFCYKTGVSGDPTTSDSVVYEDGTFSTGAYSLLISGLTSNTNYRIRAYAINSSGTAYGTTIQATTLVSQTGTGFLLTLLNK